MREQQRDERMAPEFIFRERALYESKDLIQMVFEILTLGFRGRAGLPREEQLRNRVVENAARV